MKNHRILLLTLLLFGALSSTYGNKLQMFMYYCPFDNPDKEPFIETYITFIGKTLTYVKNESGKYQATVEITLTFTQDDKIVNFKKYNLSSPEIDDTTTSIGNFIDQQRYALPAGVYNMSVEVRDLNDNTSFFKHHDLIALNFDRKSIEISGIQLIESYKKTEQMNILSKSGFDLVPYVSSFYPDNISSLSFYCEVYNTSNLFTADETFLVKYYIKSFKSRNIHGEFNGFKKKNAQKLVPILAEFDISKLPSGNYNLVVEVLNRNNEKLASKEFFFQRSNSKMYVDMQNMAIEEIEKTFVKGYNSIDTLTEYIKCLAPISDEREELFAKNVLSKPDLSQMQSYFYSFWSKRSITDPEMEWKKYKDQVELVNKSYSTQIKKGYETDKGRVYLMYGAPNQIHEEKHDPSAYPYEIWQYYTLERTNQNNVKFVFYNPELVGNDFVLLHSDASGELRTNNWDMILHKRDTPQWDLDQNNSGTYYGGSSNSRFNE